jgi:N utilization substance protein B
LWSTALAEADGEPSRPAAGGRDRGDRIRAWRAGRRVALAAVFEADFGQRTAQAILERHLAETESDPDAAELARTIVDAVVRYRVDIDARIEQIAPHYPVVQLARMDRALLRCAVGEVLHSATPARVAIAEWVELARTYSGDPARRLMNGVLGRLAATAPDRPPDRGISTRNESRGTEPPTSNSEEGVSGRRHLRSAEEDRR